MTRPFTGPDVLVSRFKWFRIQWQLFSKVSVLAILTLPSYTPIRWFLYRVHGEPASVGTAKELEAPPEIPYKSVIKGDAKHYSIAAASILAKVTRDRIMRQYDLLYPEYGFIQNKGYGTAKHIQAIKEKGICEIHRRSFVKNFI